MNTHLGLLLFVIAVHLGCYANAKKWCSKCCYTSIKYNDTVSCSDKSCDTKCDLTPAMKIKNFISRRPVFVSNGSKFFRNSQGKCGCRCFVSIKPLMCGLDSGFLPLKKHPTSKLKCSRCSSKNKKPRKFPDPETACKTVNATFSPSTNTCFKFFPGDHTRKAADALCIRKAPFNLHLEGRLAVIPNEQIFNLVFPLTNARFWFGLKAKDPQKVTNGFGRNTFEHADEWAFIDLDEVVSELTYIPFTMFVDEHSPCIRVDVNRAYNDLPCDSKAAVLCEFYKPGNS